MQDFETLCFQNRTDWLRLLVAYALAEEAAAGAEAALAKLTGKSVATPAVFTGTTIGSEADGEESTTGWVARVSQLEGVEATQLSTLHGRVIALGYLKFKLIDRLVGLRYRLTPAGKQLAQSRPETTEAAA